MRHLSQEVGLAVERRPDGFLTDRSRHDCLKVSPKDCVAGGSQVSQSALAGLWRTLPEFNFRCIVAEIPKKKAGPVTDIGDRVDPRPFYARRKQRSISFEDGAIRKQHPAGGRQYNRY